LDRRTARARRAAELEGWEEAEPDEAPVVLEALVAEKETVEVVAAKAPRKPRGRARRKEKG
jgi:hypothetical protein